MVIEPVTDDPAQKGQLPLVFVPVSEKKVAKNRCHVDLHAADRPSVQTEADRLVALGATVLRAPAEEYGAYWATLSDPEGNELCIGAP